MELANEYGLTSIAFPAISCGRYAYPSTLAAEIAISTISSMLKLSSVNSVFIALLDAEVTKSYRMVLETAFK